MNTLRAMLVWGVEKVVSDAPLSASGGTQDFVIEGEP